ncbi:MAG: hypothetical protein IKY96_04550 [Oscillospiraceae bacterium]|nr:hypothetical protein [Oscillospiraceae bacterium]
MILSDRQTLCKTEMRFAVKKIVSEIVKRVRRMEDRTPILVAIDGSCTSGKSTLGVMLAQELDANLFRVDDYFLRPEQRTAERLAEIGGNVDYERFREEVLLPLKKGKPFAYRPYDCSTGALKQPVEVTPKRINIIEGSYSHHPYFEDPYDLKVFLKIAPEIRLQRIGMRPAFLRKRFLEAWIPMEQRYFECFSIEEKADLVAWPEDNR